ncbi:MAG: OmpP1/FadL family transporter [Cryomorphaceae bacterium]
MKKSLLILALLLAHWSANAQSEADVQRYSTPFHHGTARFNALGGAMGALGGDVSAIHLNPASIGVFRYGDVSFTPTIEMNSLETRTPSFIEEEQVSKFVVNSAGLVLANETNHPDWKQINFGISYNRLSTFNDELFYQADVDYNQSLQSDFINEANGFLPSELSDFSAGLAWDGFVINNPDSANPTNYIPAVGSGRINQIQTISREGRHGETSLSFGTNYRDKAYIGIALGIQAIRYEQETETREAPISGQSDLVNYSYLEELVIEGVGVNFSIGGIVKVGKIFRVGGSIKTPTVLNLNDNFRYQLNSRFVNPSETYESQSDVGVFDYKVRTPWKFMGSVAAVLGKKGLITTQYEFANISKGELRNAGGANEDFSFSNQILIQDYTAMHTARAGLEYRIDPSWYARLGFAYFSNPAEANEFTGADLNRYQYSGGFGYRKAAWHIDLTYQHTKFEELYIANNSGPLTFLTSEFGSISITAGFRL